VDLEIDRAGASKFAVKLDWNILLARYTQVASLKIFDFRSTDIGAEYNVLKILDDFEITESLEHDDIKQTIIDAGTSSKWERAAVKTAVSVENNRSFSSSSLLRCNN